MGVEIERKFLVTSNSWRDNATPLPSIQGYISYGPPMSLRIRIMDGEAKLNLKQSTLDIQRAEFEYPIPLEDAQQLLENSIMGSPVQKNRYIVQHAEHRWEIDEFLGDNQGLIVAEIELTHRDETFDSPPWLGEEVSGDPRYFNTHLAQTPFTLW
jgi:adenylate cyclase